MGDKWRIRKALLAFNLGVSFRFSYYLLRRHSTFKLEIVLLSHQGNVWWRVCGVCILLSVALVFLLAVAAVTVSINLILGQICLCACKVISRLSANLRTPRLIIFELQKIGPATMNHQTSQSALYVLVGHGIQ